jgi:hypothetical protein
MTTLSLGAKNTSVEEILRSYLSAGISGKGVSALLAALAISDRYKAELAEAAFDQLFKSTASGKYLDRRASDDGIVRPANIGISDEIFRKLTIKTTARKVVSQVVSEILEAYYGSEATRAYSTGASFAPYNFTDGDDLLLEMDGAKPLTIIFKGSDFQAPSAATALEVATVITQSLRKLGQNGYAVPFTDPSLSKSFVRIFSGALGLSGSVRVLGGRAQNQLLFPSRVHALGVGAKTNTAWSLTPGNSINGISSGVVRIQWIGGPTPLLADVHDGDYVNIYGPGFDAGNRGAFIVIAVTPTYFEVSNVFGVAQGNVTQTNDNDLVFFRPERRTIHSTGRMALASQGETGLLDVILPATTQAVGRGVNSAAYVHAPQTSINVVSGTRNAQGLVTLTTATPHDFDVGNGIFVDGLIPNISMEIPEFIDADPSLVASGTLFSASTQLTDGRVFLSGGFDPITGDITNLCFLYSDTNGWTEITPMSWPRSNHSCIGLKNGRVLVLGGAGSGTSCEIYDPASDTWSMGANTANDYENASLTLLNDGRVLAVGSSAEIYNPITALWTEIQAPNFGRIDSAVIKLSDGRVLFAGGFMQSTSEIYNPINNQWIVAGSISSSRYGAKLAKVNIGYGERILISGGATSTGSVFNTCELFNPSTLTWSSAAPMNYSRDFHTLTVMKDGRVLAAGGGNGTADILISETYDPIRNRWTAGDSMNSGHYSADSFWVGDGRILFTGGCDAAFTTPSYSEYYVPVTNVGAGGGMNGEFRVESTPTTNMLTYLTPDYAYETVFSNGTISSAKSLINEVHGPFSYDLEKGSAITKVQTILTEPILVDSSNSIISVNDSSLFPDKNGWICFGFGTKDVITPIPYFGRVSNQHLTIIPGFGFTKSIPAGTTVTLLTQRGPWTPENPEDVGSFYVTASASGRVAASAEVEGLVAAGVQVNKTVIYPSDKGLGNEGSPTSGSPKISDKVVVWGGDSLDDEIETARDT